MFMNMKPLMLLPLIILVASCSDQTTSTKIPVSSDTLTLITLKRSVCFGFCPEYDVTISADGLVTFDGKSHVRSIGRHTARISADSVQQLIAELEQANYFSLNDRYQDVDDGCVALATDMPSAYTSVQIPGKSKSISHYHGCLTSTEPGKMKIHPEVLVKLEDRIDEVAGTNQWVE